MADFCVIASHSTSSMFLLSMFIILALCDFGPYGPLPTHSRSPTHYIVSLWQWGLLWGCWLRLRLPQRLLAASASGPCWEVARGEAVCPNRLASHTMGHVLGRWPGCSLKSELPPTPLQSVPPVHRGHLWNHSISTPISCPRRGFQSEPVSLSPFSPPVSFL
jgi:hypothetical protein